MFGIRIVNLKTEPTAQLNPDVENAILEADLVILGPGDFYTNTVANLVVEGMADALKKTSAKLLFITNLMTSPSETPGYAVSDFFTDLQKYLPLSLLDFVLINNNHNFPAEVVAAYHREYSDPVVDDLDQFKKQENDFNASIIRADILSEEVAEKVPGDAVARSMVRHSPEKLAGEVMQLLGQM